MKNILTFLLVSGFLLITPSWGSGPKAQVTAEISYQTFYDQLSPYGHWVSYSGYGYVWSPSVGAGFRPYSSGGHWVWSDQGWCWVSDYSWGWAPFHYGRWFYDAGQGWLWVPGNDWSPAWVAWRSGGDSYGWAPISPGFSISVGFSSYQPPVNYWCFAPQRYIASPNVSQYYVGASRNTTYIHQTTIINNYSTTNNIYRAGPPIADVQRVTHQQIQARPIHMSSGPGRAVAGNGEVTMYRPAVSRAAVETAAPRSVAHLKGSPRPSLPAGETRNPAEYQNVSRAAEARAGHSDVAKNDPGAKANPEHPADHGVPATHAAPAEHGAPATHAAPVTHSEPARHSQPATHAAPVTHADPAHHSAPATHTAPATHAAPVTHSAPPQHSAPAPHAAPVTHAAPPPAQHQAPPATHAAPVTHAAPPPAPHTAPPAHAAPPVTHTTPPAHAKPAPQPEPERHG